MKIRNYTGIVAALCLFASVGSASSHSAKHHAKPSSDDQPQAHKHRKHAAADAEAQARHLARLAKQEKRAWDEHLALVKAMPRHERIAMIHHDRRYARQQQEAQQEQAEAAKKQAREEHREKERIAEMTPHQRRMLAEHNARLAAQQEHETHLAALHEKREHLEAMAERHSHDEDSSEPDRRLTAHERRLAEEHRDTPVISAHGRHIAALLAAHNARLAELQQEHNARLFEIENEHEAHVRHRQQLAAQRALTYQAHLAKVQSEHDARVAADRANWVAMHGDGSGGRSIQFWQTEAYGVPVKCITVDLNDSNVKVSAVMSRDGSGSDEPFRQMIDRANPNVAVTGTFFSLDNRQPVGDIVIDGSLVHFGGMGTALCVTPNNQAKMITVEWGRHHDWSPYDFVCACGPRLLENGQVVLDPHAERFHDRDMLAPNSRIAVGITSGNKLVFAMTRKPIYLGRLAKVMRALGATEAMNLDAGTSTGFYYNGATLARPGRRLTNMIVVYGTKDRYERALDQLIPSTYKRIDPSLRGQISQTVAMTNGPTPRGL